MAGVCHNVIVPIPHILEIFGGRKTVAIVFKFIRGHHAEWLVGKYALVARPLTCRTRRVGQSASGAANGRELAQHPAVGAHETFGCRTKLYIKRKGVNAD